MSFDFVKHMGELRAAGANFVKCYNAMMAAAGNPDEKLLMAAEIAATTGGSATTLPPPEVLAQAAASGRTVAGAYIEPVVQTGTPGTETMSVTGHVLSLPKPGESFAAYCGRVNDQAGGNPDNVGSAVNALVLGWGDLALSHNGGKWTLAADWFFNQRAYMTPEERAAEDARQAAWGAVHERMTQG